jgi:hypothetical protein
MVFLGRVREKWEIELYIFITLYGYLENDEALDVSPFCLY